jgi:A/G-specific adenine glycosylase
MSQTPPLLAWYERHRRSLPWRSDRSPYRVVVSEFMLQQTQVDRVVPVFERFVTNFPSFAALAEASSADVVRAWRGLGYNSRAVRLQRLAKAVCERHGGTLPSDGDALRALPGVGPYTVAAIRAFAFDIDGVALDTNIRRIVHRTRIGLEVPEPASAKAVEAAALSFVVPGRANDVNSALMDLGATICTARAPKCLVCPLRDVCAAAPVDAGALAAHAKQRVKASERVPFERTSRFLRGRIVDALRALAPHESISLLDLHGMLATVAPDRSPDEIAEATQGLARDGVVAFDGATIALAR